MLTSSVIHTRAILNTTISIPSQVVPWYNLFHNNKSKSKAKQIVDKGQAVSTTTETNGGTPCLEQNSHQMPHCYISGYRQHPVQHEGQYGSMPDQNFHQFS